jgi:hypothetical protein
MAGLVRVPGWAELGSPMSSTRKPGEKAMTFVRYLVAICIGIAGTLAWQSYGEATKQIIATTAPELGWSPEAKQMIANWVQQLGWTKSPADSEKQGAPVAQTAPTTPPSTRRRYRRWRRISLPCGKLSSSSPQVKSRLNVRSSGWSPLS